MLVNQVYTIVNTMTQELLGKSDIVLEDLSNVVDVGNTLLSNVETDNYVKALINQVGKMVFVDRKYQGCAPEVLMDSWEYGSVLEKVRMEMPVASENDSWKLVDKQSYDQDIFYQPKVTAKFFNKRTTFEIPISFTEMQVKESFQSATQLNAFITMIYNAIEKAMTVRIDSLIMRTINNFIAATINSEYDTAGIETKSTVKAINLLFLYNEQVATADKLTADKCLTNPDFIRFASTVMGLTKERMSKLSTLFNIGKKETFTPSDRLVSVLLADFQKSAEVYLYNGKNQFGTEYLKLPNASIVPQWQGSGTDYSFTSTSKIHVKCNLESSKTAEVTATGVLGVMFPKSGS